MSQPIEPVALFAYYHLGLDHEYEYRFRNLHQAAAHFGVPADQIKAHLTEYGMETELIRLTGFNLSKAHADAMELDLLGAPVAAREQFVRDTWAAFVAARSEPLADVDQPDVDYDDL